jgi:hypothetical protein
MSEKILVGLNEYHSLMLAISAICCIAILYFYMKNNKINILGKSSKKSKKSCRNLSWGVVNSHNIMANSREPVYQIYSVY